MRVTNLTIQLVEDVIRTAFILNAELNWRPTYLFVFGIIHVHCTGAVPSLPLFQCHIVLPKRRYELVDRY